MTNKLSQHFPSSFPYEQDKCISTFVTKVSKRRQKPSRPTTLTKERRRAARTYTYRLINNLPRISTRSDEELCHSLTQLPSFPVSRTEAITQRNRIIFIEHPPVTHVRRFKLFPLKLYEPQLINWELIFSDWSMIFPRVFPRMEYRTK